MEFKWLIFGAVSILLISVLVLSYINHWSTNASASDRVYWRTATRQYFDILLFAGISTIFILGPTINRLKKDGWMIAYWVGWILIWVGGLMLAVGHEI